MSSPAPDHSQGAIEGVTGRDFGDTIRYVEHFESTGNEVWLSACKMQLEGIVSKRLDAPYVSGRHGGWTKAKCRAGNEVVLGGWATTAGRFRSLLAGVYRNGRLEYAGRIGTGYGESVTGNLLPALKKYTTDVSPFSGKDAPRKESNIHWLKPELVAEIDFAGWTATNMIRHASFKGLRRDKPATEVVDERTTSEPTPEAEKPAAHVMRAPAKGTGPNVVRGVTLSSPDKVMWPEAAPGGAATKLDLAKYYEAVGEWLLPHLRGRPCSLVRAPDGINGEQFFQRHAMAGISDLFTLVKVRGDKAPYVQIDQVETLIAVAQIGALELHPWNCAEGDPEVAGRLVFDLDPAPEVKFGAVITAALEIRDRLKKVGLESFCKTTGGKGLHVVTPLTGGKDAVAWPAAKNFAHIICAQMARDSPTKYLDTMSKKDRVGRIFLDYLRNDRTSTAVAVLSTRARPGAPVSMPIHWKEVKATLKPERFNIRTGPEILKKSKPWGDYERVGEIVDRSDRESPGKRSKDSLAVARQSMLAASLRKAPRGSASIVSPCETMIRRRSSRSAQRLNCCATSLLCLPSMSFTGPGTCGSSPANPMTLSSHPPRPLSPWMSPIRSLTMRVRPSSPSTSSAESARDLDVANRRVAEVGRAGIDAHDFADLLGAGTWRHDSHARISPRVARRIQPMPEAGDDQEGGPAERFELGHIRFAQCDRAEDDEAARFQSNCRHAPRQIEQRHLQIADDGDDALVDARQFAVRQHGPFFERCGHARMEARSRYSAAPRNCGKLLSESALFQPDFGWIIPRQLRSDDGSA